MQKRLLIVAALLAVALVAALFLPGERAMGVGSLPRIDETSLNALQTAAEAPTLLFNGAAAVQDESGVYYIPQDCTQEGWSGLLALSGPWKLYATAQTRQQMADKAGLIASGQSVEFVGVSDGQAARVRVVFTGLPVMGWTTDPDRTGTKEDGRTLYYGTMSFFDTDGRVTQCDIRYNERGSYSLQYDKKGYKLNLVQADGSNLQKSLAGLRIDDDWQLRALYTDPQKVREMAATEAWNQLATLYAHDYPTSSMAYVELVMDGEYMGLYALCERLDDKQVEADKNDIVYKNGLDTKALAEFDEETGWPAEILRDGHMGSVKIYGNGGNLPDPWQPYNALMDLLYEDEGYSADYAQLTALLNVENAVDWGLFKQALALYDNDLHNLYWLAHDTGTGYRMYYIPYDMDLSFGHFPDGLAEEPFGLLDWANTRLFDTPALTALLEVDPETMAPLVNRRWVQLRQGPLSNENLFGLLQSAQDEVVNSGAFARDSARWPGQYNDADLTATYEWMTTRLAYLDEYYGPEGWSAAS